MEQVRYVGGYGRMAWVDAGAYAAAEPDPLPPASAAILIRMTPGAAAGRDAAGGGGT